jgi:tetratricopeptide (TPR) repeat protein
MLKNIIDYQMTRALGLLLIASFVVLTGCAGKSAKPSAVVEPVSKSSVPVLSEADKSQFKNGLTALEAKQYDEARSVFQGLLSTHPNLAGAAVNLGLIEQAQGHDDKARKQFEAALGMNPSSISARLQIAALDQKEGKFAAAEQHLLTAHNYKPKHSLINYNLGVLYELYLQDYDKAIDHYQLYVDHSAKNDVKTVQRWIKLLERK